MPAPGISKRAPIGKRFGRVVVMSLTRSGPGHSVIVDCKCDCGDVRPYFVGNLATQKEPMCPPCREASRPAKGQSGKHPLFNIWKAMIQRCENPNHTWYKKYGGRGVSICARWREDFQAFAADMGDRPSMEHTVDRIDVNGNYEPGNVRWATQAEQMNNTTVTPTITWQGREYTLTEAVQETGIDRATLAYRMKAGWVPDEIMTIPSMCTANRGKAKPRKAA